VASYAEIVATVPDAATSGQIGVTTPGGTGTSDTPFLVEPTITGFTPASGRVGTLVTITGSGFAGATVVRFNQAAAAFTVVSGSEIAATVPTRAKTGPISVTTAGGTAYSSTAFKVRKGG
jgi:hypothetical protein